MNMKRFIAILACLVLGLSVFAVASAVEAVAECTHTWKWVWYGLPEGKEVGPDCEINTVKRLECTKCGEWYTVEVVPATGHKWVEDKGAYIAPTCVDKGWRHYACDNCNETKNEKIKPTEKHTWQYKAEDGSWVDTKAKAYKNPATCKDPAFYDVKCKVCDKVDIEKEGKPVDHKWVEFEGADYREPSCTVDGFVEMQCAYGCGEFYHKVIPALGHLSIDAEYVPATVATCTVDGRKAGKICTRVVDGVRCGEYVEGGEVIPALGHKWKLVPAAPATCVNDPDPELYNVDAYKVCERCGEKDPANAPVKTKLSKEEAFALHDFVPLNKNKDGKVIDYVCTRCGYIADAAEVEPKPDPETQCTHEWKEGEIVKAPTCTKAGIVKAECIKCGKTQEIEKKATGHTLVTIKQEGAKKLVACYVCDYSAWIGHEHLWCNVKQTVPATCVSGATYLQGCYYCDAIRYNKSGIKNPDGHAWCQAIDPATGIQVTCCYYCDARK